MSNTAINSEIQNELNNARMPQHNSAPLNVPNVNDKPKNSAADGYKNVAPAGDDHEGNLAAARSATAKSEAAKAKDLAGDAVSAATPMGAFSLLKQIEPMKDMPYVAALGAALLKDLLVLATFETVILPIVFSMLCSIFIFMMMMLVGGNGKRKGANVIFKKIGFLLGGGILGSIPGLDILPFETITVGIIYFMTLSERKHA